MAFVIFTGRAMNPLHDMDQNVDSTSYWTQETLLRVLSDICFVVVI